MRFGHFFYPMKFDDYLPPATSPKLAIREQCEWRKCIYGDDFVQAEVSRMLVDCELGLTMRFGHFF